MKKEGGTTSDQNQTLEETAGYFEELFRDRQIPEEPTETAHQTHRDMGNTKLLTQAIKVKDVKNTIKALKKGKAAGPDLIPNEALKRGIKSW